MEKSNLPFAFDLFLNYPIAGRLQPVIVLEQAIRNLGRIDSNNYINFRYLQLELIVKQCELLSDVAGYIKAVKTFRPTQSIEDNGVIFKELFKSLTDSRGGDVHSFFKCIANENEPFFYEIMGYDILDKIPSAAETLKKVGDLNDSVDIVKSIFKEMAYFYDTFWNVYNAYKHGNRLFIDRAKCELVEFSGVSGNLDAFQTDAIILAYKEGKKNPAIAFNRGLAEYKHQFFYLFKGIVSAYTIKWVNAYFGFLDYDLSSVNGSFVWVFRRNGDNIEGIDIRLSLMH